ncbi:response regulator transcription factor [Paenibacillus lutrae]|uniref:Response regulator n=1 Tax=Paenibacillus lutrae TaxID=2078573 RepID=A0A7X3FGQ4_9BACL|nr:response regulator [Paenibacillus lutrae]MVO99445.1 response regulator [Paenibacillus lutrae]
MKLLWVEDERRLVEEGAFFLQQEGCVIHHAVTAEDAQHRLQANRYDLLLIDWMLPGRQGIDLCREVRSKWGTPVIILTARTEEEQKVLALENGADDYITKPFGIRELLARIRAVLRRTSMPGSTAETSAVDGLPSNASDRFFVQ